MIYENVVVVHSAVMEDDMASNIQGPMYRARNLLCVDHSARPSGAHDNAVVPAKIMHNAATAANLVRTACLSKHLQATTLVTVAGTLLVWSFEIYRFLELVASVKQHISPSAKQMKIPILRLAVGVTSDVAGYVALNSSGMVTVVEISIIVPTPGVHS